MIVHDAKIQQAGPSAGALAVPLGPPDRPRTVGPVAMVARVLPFEVPPGALPVDADVRPHPHIGLVALSWLLDGHVTHRDSLGNRHEAGPGGLCWTFAGRGATHSERLERPRLLGGRLDLVQILLALPDGHEEDEPAFVAVAAAEVPTRVADGATVRTLAGAGTRLAFPGALLLEDVALDAGGAYRCPAAAERGLFVLEGEITVGDVAVRANQTVLLDADAPPARSAGGARLLALGGDRVGPRWSWWNFIHSSLDRIEQAKARWRAGGFTLPVGDTESFTPAPPDDGRPLVHLNATEGS